MKNNMSDNTPGQKSASRKMLLQAAGDLMTERGTIDISLNEIAQRAQRNSALIKYYFGNKSGLMFALIEDVLVSSLDQLKGLLEMDLSPIEKLKLHVKGVINVYFRYPFINRLIHAALADEDQVKRVSAEISKPLAETQRQLLQQGVESGVFKSVDPMMFYFMIMGACEEIFFGQDVLEHAFGIKGVDEQLKRSYTNALLNMVMGGILTDEAR